MALPGSILFLCDRNTLRSALAAGMMRRMFAGTCEVRSAGVQAGAWVDGFAVAVAEEIGVDLEDHIPESLDQLAERGEDIARFERVVALSPAAQHCALQAGALVEYWPTLDPSDLGAGREARLGAYRQTRDALLARIRDEFAGPALL
ncbi:MAG: low molecular weight phosphatase family protein [Pseudomonadota bacterium]